MELSHYCIPIGFKLRDACQLTGKSFVSSSKAYKIPVFYQLETQITKKLTCTFFCNKMSIKILTVKIPVKKKSNHNILLKEQSSIIV